MVQFRLAVALASLIALVAVLVDVGYAKDAVVSAIQNAPKPVGSSRKLICVRPYICGIKYIPKIVKCPYRCYRYKYKPGCKFVGYYCYKIGHAWKCYPVYRCKCVAIKVCKVRIYRWCLRKYPCLSSKYKYRLDGKSKSGLSASLSSKA